MGVVKEVQGSILKGMNQWSTNSKRMVSGSARKRVKNSSRVHQDQNKPRGSGSRGSLSRKTGAISSPTVYTRLVLCRSRRTLLQILRLLGGYWASCLRVMGTWPFCQCLRISKHASSHCRHFFRQVAL